MESILLPGIMLIAHSGLLDPNFRRTVVFLTEHNEAGSVGYVVNRKLEVTLADVMGEQFGSEALLAATIPLYWGGPCQIDSLHYVHRLNNTIEGAQHVTGTIHWGGNVDEIFSLLRDTIYSPDSIRFFVGYAGWAQGQIQKELDEQSWLVSACNENIVFSPTDKNLWSRAVKNLGTQFTAMSLLPEHPSLN